MRVGSFRENVQNIGRMRHILRIMVKYGFGYFVSQLHLERSLFGGRIFRPLVSAAILDMPAPVRLRKALEELGPTFIKFGQVLSMRPDILPIEYVSELEKLQDSVPGYPYYLVEIEIEQELKKPASELFRTISPTPKASASLAQVHEAQLKSGEAAVVKVQRPGIEAVIDRDISILYQIAQLAERYYRRAQLFDAVGIVEEFQASIKRELDFVNEAFNIERFQRQFKNDPTVLIPRVYRGLSSKRVLTMERVDGIKITDIVDLDKAGFDRKRVAENGVNALLKQIFLYGFFHADPHAGNLMVVGNDTVAFLDFGMVGRIHGETKAKLLQALLGIIDKDPETFRNALLSLGNVRGPIDTQGLDLDVEEFIDRYYGRPLKELHVSQILSDIVAILSRYRIRLPSDLFLLAKSLIIADGIGRRLDPDFNIVENIKPCIEEMQRQKYRPSEVLRIFRRTAYAVLRFAQTLPQDLITVFNKIKRGELQIEFEHKGLEQLTTEIDRSSNRISFSLIIAALIIGSSIIVHSNRGPQYFGFPILGLSGFVVAGIMGLWLAIVILRSGQF